MHNAVTNPYLPSWEYVPDGEPHVFGDRLYIFGSHDRFGGTLHSNGNILSEGQQATYFWGNNHGSIERINCRFYAFGHRQTNCNECTRQGVAEPLRFEGSGKLNLLNFTVTTSKEDNS